MPARKVWLIAMMPIIVLIYAKLAHSQSLNNEQPDCSNAYPSIESIYPPDGRFHTINILGIKEPENDLIKIQINEIVQDEPLDISYGGAIVPSAFYYIDDEGVLSGTIKLKATIGINREQRTYSIYFTAFDSEGGSCCGMVKVCIDSEPGKKCPQNEDKRYNFQQSYDAMSGGRHVQSGLCGCTSPDCLWCKNHGYSGADDCCSFKSHRTKHEVRERYCYWAIGDGHEVPPTANLLTSKGCPGYSDDICNISDGTCSYWDGGCGYCFVCRGSTTNRACSTGQWCVGQWSSWNYSSWTEWDAVAKASLKSSFRPWDCDCVDVNGGKYASSYARSYQGDFYGNPTFVSLWQKVSDAGWIYNYGWEWTQSVERGYYCSKLIQLKGDLVCQRLGTPIFDSISRTGIIGNPNKTGPNCP